MKQLKMPLLAALIGILVTTALVATFTFAADTTETDENAPPLMQKRQYMQQAFENQDYDSWKAMQEEMVQSLRLKADTIESNISQDTFSKMSQARQLMQEGKIDEAKAIFEELGMQGPGGFGRGFHKGFKAGHGDCLNQN